MGTIQTGDAALALTCTACGHVCGTEPDGEYVDDGATWNERRRPNTNDWRGRKRDDGWKKSRKERHSYNGPSGKNWQRQGAKNNGSWRKGRANGDRGGRGYGQSGKW